MEARDEQIEAEVVGDRLAVRAVGWLYGRAETTPLYGSGGNGNGILRGFGHCHGGVSLGDD